LSNTELAPPSFNHPVDAGEQHQDELAGRDDHDRAV